MLQLSRMAYSTPQPTDRWEFIVPPLDEMLPGRGRQLSSDQRLWLDSPMALRKMALMWSFTAASSAPTSAAISVLLLTGFQEKKNVSFWICQGSVPGVVEIGRGWKPICARVLNS